MRPIARLLTYRCGNAENTVGLYHRSLHQQGISPFEDGFDRQSFQQVINKVSYVPPIRFNHCDVRRCSCFGMSPHDLAEQLRKEIQKWEESEHYFCLDCFKTSGRSKKEEACRISHL